MNILRKIICKHLVKFRRKLIAIVKTKQEVKRGGQICVSLVYFEPCCPPYYVLGSKPVENTQTDMQTES
jgi:hypothetical protein